jgi:sugar lactone lactonase YvrE
MTDILLDGLTFPEGPRWHDGRLWFSDFYSHRVLAVDLTGKVETIVEVPQQPSGLGWLPDGSLLVVSMLDQKLMRFAGGALGDYADLSAHATGPCNDMVVDGRGRAYVGNFGFDRSKGEPERTTCLIRVDPDRSVSVAAEDLLFPNGTVITPDGKKLIVGETIGQALTIYDIAEDGSLANRGVFAAMPEMFPDGICLDAEGAVWFSNPRKGYVARVFEGGRVERTIQLDPGRGAFACMLGGDDGRTLFICSNSGSGPDMASKKDGRIETVRVDVPAAGWP